MSSRIKSSSGSSYSYIYNTIGELVAFSSGYMTFISNFSFRHDLNHAEQVKKLRTATDITKFRNSSEYAGIRSGRVDPVVSQDINIK